MQIHREIVDFLRLYIITDSVIIIACSKRSDSGERCGVKKAMKSTSPPPSLLFFRAPFYFAPLPTM